MLGIVFLLNEANEGIEENSNILIFFEQRKTITGVKIKFFCVYK